MQEFFNYFVNYYIIQTAADVPFSSYVLVHLFFIIPINAGAFIFAFVSMSKPRRIRERRLMIGAFCMLAITAYRLWLNSYLDTSGGGIVNIVKFELSEMAMYMLLLAVFVVKKQWIYPIAFIMGMISWFAVVIYPYTVFSNYMPFHTYSLASFIFHVLNGYLAVMLIVARGYEPKVKHFYVSAICFAFVFVFIYIMNEVMDQNFLVFRDPSRIPILSEVPVPYHILVIYAAVNVVSFLILLASEKLYNKFVIKTEDESKKLRIEN